MNNSSSNGQSKGNRTLALLVAASLSACTVGPDYRRPVVEIPPAWRLAAAEAGEISNVAWWEQFQDPALSTLVRTALENNEHLQIATASVDQAFARYGITRSALWPQIDAGTAAARQRLSGSAGPVPVSICGHSAERVMPYRA